MAKKKLTFEEKVKIKDKWADKQDAIYQKRIKKVQKLIDKKDEDIKKLKDKIYQIEIEGHRKYNSFIAELREK